MLVLYQSDFSETWFSSLLYAAIAEGFVPVELREMRQKADSEKRDQAAAIASMSSIEAKAQAQYRKDLKESQEAKRNLTGLWVSIPPYWANWAQKLVPRRLFAGLKSITSAPT